jgi:hypothetical protein
MKQFILLFSFLFVTFFAIAQKGQIQSKSGVFYIAIGTHDAYYTKSDIHLKTSTFDFILKNVKGTDDKFLHATGGPIQYDYQVGYYFKNKNFGIEYNFDHVKYFARHDQSVRTVGTVNGQKVDEVLPITTYVQNFEHTNGANYILLNFVKWKELTKAKNSDRILNLLLKAGTGIVLPRTNSTIMNNHRDDTYNIAGYLLALEGGLRYNLAKHFFAEATLKGAYANYKRILIANGHGDQHWFSGQMIFMLGYQL